ncbi:MAG TPA: TetR/AcrR family transcriptional regulator C-terminal domain-containing protein, partial [Pseudonocardiaceae bacterium]|nr:TetR/AcrR family transcriptional regulator C-terminal domain-containing protein [Pseudonocardiaceae bacterium]
QATMLSILATGDFPMFARLLDNEYDFDLGVLFEFGLQRMLDGLEILVNRGAISPPPTPPV